MKALRNYLLKEHTEETVKIYLRDINVFLDYLPEARAEKATYKDIMNYVDHLRKQYQNPRTINRMLYGVKAWYHWLIQTGKREDHPCRYLTLKDAKYQDIQLQDLFTETELELLMDRKERYESVRIRNQVIVSLLIYQALRLKELVQLRLKDIDLEAGTVYTKGMAKTLPRTLKMKTKQIMLFYKYIHEIRTKIIKEETDILILNIRGKPMEPDGINYIIGALIIKHKLNLSDEETLQTISENPYMQFFLGLDDYSPEILFSPSLFVEIRKRLGQDTFNEFSELIMSLSLNPSSTQKGDEQPSNQGKLKIDATVADQYIRYPNDLSLVNEARLKSEKIIDQLYILLKDEFPVKPRTYRKVAHQRYLQEAKKKQKSAKSVRKAIRLYYLVETFKPLFPDRNLNAKTIRQSVITNLLKQKKDLRVVQVFAGHKKPSSTERYRQTGLEELKAAVLKHHPLG
jgi:integrase/recombinase XerD